MVGWFRSRFLVSVATGAVLVLAVAGCDWLQPGFSGGNSSANPYEPALTASTVGSLSQRFTLSFPSSSYGTPVVAGGVLYASLSTSGIATVSAFQAGIGTALWTTELPAGGAVSNVAYDSGRVFVEVTNTSTILGAAYALDAHTGAILWTQNLLDLSSGPVIDGGRLFFATSTPMLVSPMTPPTEGIAAVDEATGSPLWETTFPNYGTFSGTPVASNGFVSIVGTAQKNPPVAPFSPATYVFHESDGSSAGTYNLTTVSTAANGLMYGQNNATPSALEAIDPTSGNVVWSVPAVATGSTTAPPAAVSSSSFVFGGNGRLTALDAHTGATQWTAAPPSGVTLGTASPVIAGALVYVLGTNSAGSVLVTYDAATGAVTATIPVVSGASGVIVAEGSVFIQANGTITAYGLPSNRQQDVSGPFTGIGTVDGGTAYSFSANYTANSGGTGSFYLSGVLYYTAPDFALSGSMTLTTPDGTVFTGTPRGGFPANGGPLEFSALLESAAGQVVTVTGTGTFTFPAPVNPQASTSGPINGTLTGM